ncbi:glycosyltransferase family 1 protein [Corynascus similis CBS 632.67]
MVNGVNGVGGCSDDGSSSGSNSVNITQVRELKRRRVDLLSNDGVETHQNTPQTAPPGRRCFVTVGATAGFRALLDEVSTSGFCLCLAEHGYTTLEVQCGPDEVAFAERVARLSDDDKHGVTIRSFGYTGNMQAHILDCRGQAGVRPAGCVISHGGTGTVGEVLGIGAPLIVVANPTLMDNHQLELAESLEEQNVAVHGRIGSLAVAIDRVAERITQGTLDSLPPYCPPPFPVPAADRITLFDWMVLTCYPDELTAQMHIADLDQAEVDFAQQQQQQAQQVSSQENNCLAQLD